MTTQERLDDLARWYEIRISSGMEFDKDDKPTGQILWYLDAQRRVRHRTEEAYERAGRESGYRYRGKRALSIRASHVSLWELMCEVWPWHE